ncbi:hypothetical protein EDB80DRAFT_88229 [Ilyonectria destructans]|nr:hypothetical protein EDB80DRAFT_88229 [Ilyonectria destructans]
MECSQVASLLFGTRPIHGMSVGSGHHRCRPIFVRAASTRPRSRTCISRSPEALLVLCQPVKVLPDPHSAASECRAPGKLVLGAPRTQPQLDETIALAASTRIRCQLLVTGEVIRWEKPSTDLRCGHRPGLDSRAALQLGSGGTNTHRVPKASAMVPPAAVPLATCCSCGRGRMRRQVRRGRVLFMCDTRIRITRAKPGLRWPEPDFFPFSAAHRPPPGLASWHSRLLTAFDQGAEPKTVSTKHHPHCTLNCNCD